MDGLTEREDEVCRRLLARMKGYDEFPNIGVVRESMAAEALDEMDACELLGLLDDDDL